MDMFSKMGLGLALAASLAATPRDAKACGCFAPPDPSVPVLQAGERVVFTHDNGTVTLHVQIQKSGDAPDFGWLLPLPAIPTMKLGVEELFSQLIATTQPKYRLVRVTDDSCAWNAQNGRAVPSAAFESDSGGAPKDGPLVYQATAGPYAYAVLKADDKKEMFDWLTNNRYFIPAGTDAAVDQYIHPGAYFLALKLAAGANISELQPVVVQYKSDYPMIPIVLTSVAANPNMGIQVWVLGESRAIPRNYHHTILNEEHLDWFNGAQNYAEVVNEAVDEADDHHSFITEYAGDTTRMVGLLDFEGRFGNRSAFEQIHDAERYVSELRSTGFPWTSGLIAELRERFPLPDRLRSMGVTEDQYYQQLDYYLGNFRRQNPEVFVGVELDFDSVELTRLLWERIVTPTLEAGEMFRKWPKMTRLYTTLSPEEMTKDPVFSFNPTLPDVSNEHDGTLTYICSFMQDGPANTPAILTLPDGREIYVRSQTAWTERLGQIKGVVPYSSRIETLREEGAPEVNVDNSASITPSRSDEGCACSASERGASGLGSFALLALIGVALAGRRSRRV